MQHFKSFIKLYPQVNVFKVFPPIFAREIYALLLNRNKYICSSVVSEYNLAEQVSTRLSLVHWPQVSPLIKLFSTVEN